jgi:hypothetical protein
MKHFKVGLFVAVIAIFIPRAVYAQQEALLKIDVIRLDRRFASFLTSGASKEQQRLSST